MPSRNLMKPDWTKDTVYLVQFPRAGSVPDLSPFCLKAETYLRMSDYKYEVKAAFTFRLFPIVQASLSQWCVCVNTWVSQRFSNEKTTTRLSANVLEHWQWFQAVVAEGKSSIHRNQRSRNPRQQLHNGRTSWNFGQKYWRSLEKQGKGRLSCLSPLNRGFHLLVGLFKNSRICCIVFKSSKFDSLYILLGFWCITGPKTVCSSRPTRDGEITRESVALKNSSSEI